MISAKLIKDSINVNGNRLTTLQLRYPKFIHGEFMTHRVFSRNASSSRAIPTAKLLEEVRSPELRAGPVFWGKNQAGMQAAVELNDDEKIGPELVNKVGYLNLTVGLVSKDDGRLYDCQVADVTEKTMANILWNDAAMEAADIAEKLLSLGAHKQIVNRILEPFLHINVLVTATEYDNFFGLRLDKAAQPEMKALAEAMWEAMRPNEPTFLKPGEWHLPFIDEEQDPEYLDAMIKASVARSARLSYLSFDTGKQATLEEDQALYKRLVGAHPLHASPTEHQATPDEWHCEVRGGELCVDTGIWRYPNEHGNFNGWRQYRKMLPGESCAPLPNELYPTY